MIVRRAWHWLEASTRPVDSDLAAALTRRWQELPERVRTPAQLLGRRTNGCEGTHGVFPRCNLTCTPCYHGAEANRVPVDGAHTVRGGRSADGAAACAARPRPARAADWR